MAALPSYHSWSKYSGTPDASWLSLSSPASLGRRASCGIHSLLLRASSSFCWWCAAAQQQLVKWICCCILYDDTISYLVQKAKRSEQDPCGFLSFLLVLLQTVVFFVSRISCYQWHAKPSCLLDVFVVHAYGTSPPPPQICAITAWSVTSSSPAMYPAWRGTLSANSWASSPGKWSVSARETRWCVCPIPGRYAAGRCFVSCIMFTLDERRGLLALCVLFPVGFLK